jgi:hypothetical protein
MGSTKNYNHIDRVSLARAIAAGRELVLPWSDDLPTSLGVCFQSALIATQPFISDHPFHESSLKNSKICFHVGEGGTGRFSRACSTSVASNSEHFSATLGVSVGNSFLGASASGIYDTAVSNNKDVCTCVGASRNTANSSANLSEKSVKTSQGSYFRLGAIIFQQPPQLSKAALSLIKRQGWDAFTSKYGDYYVSALHIGGETGVMVSQHSDSRESSEKLLAKVEVQLLCFSSTWSSSSQSYESASTGNYNFSSFNTLEKSSTSVASSTSTGFKTARKHVLEAVASGAAIAKFIDDKLRLLNLINGQEIKWDTCKELAKENLILELMLVPLRTLREVQQAIALGS